MNTELAALRGDGSCLGGNEAARKTIHVRPHPNPLPQEREFPPPALVNSAPADLARCFVEFRYGRVMLGQFYNATENYVAVGLAMNW